MKVRKGFLLSYEKKLRRMIPFFVKVRSEDIVKTNPVDIGAVLVPTSQRWVEDRVEDTVDATIYRYTADWIDKSDPHNETIDPTIFSGDLVYTMYKDGRMFVDGTMLMEMTAPVDADGCTKYSVHLPYGFVENHPVLNASWSYGNVYGLNMVVQVNSIPITNAELNEDYTDQYPYHLVIWSRIQNTNARDELETFAQRVDPLFPGDMDQYLGYFPIHISYRGWWRPVQLPYVIPAEDYLLDLSGLYTTMGLIAMLSAPSQTLGKIVRSLANNTTVRNHGYYTEVDGIRWLLCTYQATGEIGYIREDMLIAQ